MITDRTVAVYGATGRTGSLICEELASRGREVVAAGRDLPKLERLSAHLGQTHEVVPTLREAGAGDRRALARVVEGVDVLVNCAGPFVDLGRPVVETAVEEGVHYLDTSGEQSHIRRVCDELGPLAEESGVIVAPACAFEYAVGCLAAALAVDGADLSEVGVCYAVRDFSPSPGTVKSVARALSEPGFAFRRGRRVDDDPASSTVDAPFPDGATHRALWFPGGEPIIVPEFRDVERCETYLAVGRLPATVLSAVRSAIPGASAAFEPVVDAVADWTSPDDPWAAGGHEVNRRAEFTVPAFEPGGACHAAVRGTDPYRSTAKIAVETALRLPLGDAAPSGFHTPASLFDAEEFARGAGLEALRP
ncbi:MAG: trans-acting enoyl reductase family protein [Bradymonadaceae bacterium]